MKPSPQAGTRLGYCFHPAGFRGLMSGLKGPLRPDCLTVFRQMRSFEGDDNFHLNGQDSLGPSHMCPLKAISPQYARGLGR